MSSKDFNAGVEACAGFLVRTAIDFDQMAEQQKKSCPPAGAIGAAAARIRIIELEGKAQLLRGQAGLVQTLKR